MTNTILFDFQKTFDTTVTIGDKQLPIHVKRFTRAEQDTFEQQWRLYVEPRGTVQRTEDEAAAYDRAQLAFFESTLTECITLDEGLVRDGETWVTTGAGLMEVFHARKDILGVFLAAVFLENRLPHIVAKNFYSPRISGPGSDMLSRQDRGGHAPDSIADSAAPSSTAETEAATASSDAPLPVNDGTPTGGA